eukprot:TRINITY_DN31546_c0_g1_i1.p1 TRINITY_DN31546_c0_g1~~TRINITY_DN31546_c0_g1_i1.p1  ORF type:complete len:126 (-),score=30.15 TRINITY_DN31546_c0_g1_i1:369-746(-)
MRHAAGTAMAAASWAVYMNGVAAFDHRHVHASKEHDFTVFLWITGSILLILLAIPLVFFTKAVMQDPDVPRLAGDVWHSLTRRLLSNLGSDSSRSGASKREKQRSEERRGSRRAERTRRRPDDDH